MQHSAKKFVVFDFDLYEPTFFVFTAIKEYLIHGDLIYFDEANNDDEYRIIKESFENTQDFKLVGASFSCLLFRFEPKKFFSLLNNVTSFSQKTKRVKHCNF
jgi:hypothetical protein